MKYLFLAKSSKFATLGWDKEVFIFSELNKSLGLKK